MRCKWGRWALVERRRSPRTLRQALLGWASRRVQEPWGFGGMEGVGWTPHEEKARGQASRYVRVLALAAERHRSARVVQVPRRPCNGEDQPGRHFTHCSHLHLTGLAVPVLARSARYLPYRAASGRCQQTRAITSRYGSCLNVLAHLWCRRMEANTERGNGRAHRLIRDSSATRTLSRLGR